MKSQNLKRKKNTHLKDEKIYMELADLFPEMVYEADQNGEIVFANRCAFEIFGYSQEDFDKGVSLFEMVIPEDRGKVLKNLQRLIKEEKVTDNQYTAMRKDGSTFPIIATSNLIFRENKSMGVRGVVIDITERKLTEEALRQECSFRNAIIEHATEGLCVCHEIPEFPYMAFTVWNDRMTEITGYTMDEINHLGWYQTLYPDLEVQARAIERMDRMRRGDDIVNEEWEITRADGEKRMLSISTSVLQTGDGLVHVLAMMHDTTQHKQADEKLRQSEEKYRTILENIADGYFEVDLVGNLTFFNDSVIQLLGYSKEELIGKNNREYMDQENADKLYQTFNRVYRTGEPTKGFGWEIIRKDGTKRFIEASVSLVMDSSDQPTGFRGIVRDITEHKHAEEALKKSEEKYRLVSENIPVAVYSALPDKHSTNLFISGKMEELTGYPSHQFIENPELWIKVIHPEDRKRVWREVDKHRQEKKSLDLEYRLITRDNIIKRIKDKATPALNEKGEIIRIDGFMEDITEKKQAEEALRESEERYRTILENIEDGYYEVDLPGNFTFFNDSLCRMLGYSREEMIGMGNQQYTDEENRKKLLQAFNEVYRTGKPIKGFGWEVFRKDGMKLFGEVSVSLIKDSTGQPIGFRGIARDITERKRTEEEIKQTLSLLNATLESTADGILVVDQEGKIESFNQKFVQMWHIPDSIIMSHDDDQALAFVLDQLKDPEGFLAKVKELYSQPEAESFDLLEFKDRRVFERYSLPQRIGEQCVGRVWSFRDVTERKKVEDSLRTEKQRLQSLTENAPFGMVMIDQDGTFRYINPKFKELFGYDLIDIPDGKTWFKKAYPDLTYRHQVISAWKEDLGSSAPGEKRSRIYTVRCKDGTEKTIHFIPVQLATRENLMACEDVTERKRAEEALAESEEKFRAMTATAADAITVMDNRGCITYWNPTAEKMFGYSPQEAIGKELHLFLAPDRYHEAYKKGFEKFRDTGQGPAINNTLEFIALRKNGTEFPMEVSTSAFKLKGQWHAVGIIRDITERKWVEDALQKSEMRFQELFNDAPVGYFEYNVEGRLTNVNRTELEMLGYKIKEMIGQPVWNFVIDKETVRKQILGKLAGTLPPSRGLERTYQRKDGTTFPVLIEDRILRDPQGKIIGMRSTIHDITDRKRVEQEMVTLEEQLRQSQKMEAIGRLAGGIAHDFNNLLTIIKGYSQLSLLDLKESDPLWGNIQEIQKATQRATDLTRQLLAFSRRQILDLKVLNLNTLLRDLDKMLRRIIGEDIELVSLLAEDLGKIRIDPGQFEQMILNLAVNSRDAMPSGGKLTIETANVELNEEYAHAHIGVTPGRYVRLSVSDTGTGMSPEVREKVFEPFFTTKETGKGTGLGLSMVYGIVKQSGGNIWVYSESGKGTTFKIYLPIVEQDLDTLEKKEETEAFPKGTETVLLVEDEPLVRDLAFRLLSQQGYTILEAANGEEALRIVNEQGGKTIQLLLTDVVMPQMGGKELADKLKSLRPDIKVLYTSGYTDNAIVHHGVLRPGTHFLQKPFSPKNLFSKVREVLDR